LLRRCTRSGRNADARRHAGTLRIGTRWQAGPPGNNRRASGRRSRGRSRDFGGLLLFLCLCRLGFNFLSLFGLALALDGFHLARLGALEGGGGAAVAYPLDSFAGQFDELTGRQFGSHHAADKQQAECDEEHAPTAEQVVERDLQEGSDVTATVPVAGDLITGER
jgi:hypothetical protein